MGDGSEIMIPNKIDYFDGGDDDDFLGIGTRDEKIKLLLNFLIKTDIEFKVNNVDEGKMVDLGKGIYIMFYDEGGIVVNYEKENEKCEI